MRLKLYEEKCLMPFLEERFVFDRKYGSKSRLDSVEIKCSLRGEEDGAFLEKVLMYIEWLELITGQQPGITVDLVEGWEQKDLKIGLRVNLSRKRSFYFLERWVELVQPQALENKMDIRINNNIVKVEIKNEECFFLLDLGFGDKSSNVEIIVHSCYMEDYIMKIWFLGLGWVFEGNKEKIK